MLIEHSEALIPRDLLRKHGGKTRNELNAEELKAAGN
jgi:hypothetical protein